jgi:hypothetical protein
MGAGRGEEGHELEGDPMTNAPSCHGSSRPARLDLAVCAMLLALTACAVGDLTAPPEDELAATAAVTTQPHAQPAYMPRSSRFSVRIKDADDGDWKPVDVIGDVNGYDYAQLSLAGGPCQIEVTARPVAGISSYSISPYRDGLTGTVSGNKLTYTIPHDQYTLVWVSGIDERLVVTADPVHTPPPAAGAHVFNVMSYAGVKNDRNNIANTTRGIQDAIDDASADAGGGNGGRGIVYVPAGAYAVGNLTLRSNMELYLAEGAAFFFASNVDGDIWNYTYRTDWTTKGNGTRWISTQDGASNLRIWGRGTLDGNANGTGSFNNNVLVVGNAHDVTIDGIVIKNGSKWGTMIARSDAVHVNHVKFFQARHGVGEDDALDVIESQHVSVTGSIGISFDDPFSVKAYTGSESYIAFSGAHEPATDITIDDAIAWTGCHAFKIGQGIGQPMSNIRFENSVVIDAAHAISIHRKAYGASIQDVTWENLDVQRISATNLGRSWVTSTSSRRPRAPSRTSRSGTSACAIRVASRARSTASMPRRW